MSRDIMDAHLLVRGPLTGRTAEETIGMARVRAEPLRSILSVDSEEAKGGTPSDELSLSLSGP